MPYLQVFRNWPLKGVLLNGRHPESASHDGQQKALRTAFYFGDVKFAADSLGMSNRLSGYVFVIDDRGLIRWRESGKMLDGQGAGFVHAVQKLVGRQAPA